MIDEKTFNEGLGALRAAIERDVTTILNAQRPNVRVDLEDGRTSVWINPAEVSSVDVHWSGLNETRLWIYVRGREMGIDRNPVVVKCDNMEERETLLRALGCIE